MTRRRQVSTPTRAFCTASGHLVVFDQHGHQVPRYQGPTASMLPLLRREWPACDVVYYHRLGQQEDGTPEPTVAESFDRMFGSLLRRNGRK